MKKFETHLKDNSDVYIIKVDEGLVQTYKALWSQQVKHCDCWMMRSGQQECHQDADLSRCLKTTSDTCISGVERLDRAEQVTVSEDDQVESNSLSSSLQVSLVASERLARISYF